MAIGDFNVILSANEKTGELSPGKRCSHFGEFVDSTNLVNFCFRGSPYIWHRDNLFKWLDRDLGNKALMENFPNCLITHLPKIESDHRPLLPNLKLDFVLPRGRSFRFFAGWVEHLAFRHFVKDKWDPNDSMADSLASLTKGLKY